MERIIKFFRETTQTNWGKNQIERKVTDIWIEHLKDVDKGSKNWEASDEQLDQIRETSGGTSGNDRRSE